VPDPDGVLIDFGRLAWRSVIGMWILSGALTYGCWTIVADSSGLEAFVGLVFLIVFGAVFVLFLIGAPAMVRKHGLIVDSKGVWTWDRDKRHLLPWTELSAAGIGYTRSPLSMLPLRQGEALELYPVPTEIFSSHAEFSRWRKTEEPPRPGLTDERYRLALPAFSRLPKKVESAVLRFAPDGWIGTYRRAFQRLPGR
jgi:hypothetical protein